MNPGLLKKQFERPNACMTEEKAMSICKILEEIRGDKIKIKGKRDLSYHSFLINQTHINKEIWLSVDLGWLSHMKKNKETTQMLGMWKRSHVQGVSL